MDHISQGSVATCLKRGGIFKNYFVANLLPSRLVKFFFENRIIVGEVMAKSLVSCLYLDGVRAGILSRHVNSQLDHSAFASLRGRLIATAESNTMSYRYYYKKNLNSL